MGFIDVCVFCFSHARYGSGYNHKLSVLMKRLVDAMIVFSDNLETELFERVKEKS